MLGSESEATHRGLHKNEEVVLYETHTLGVGPSRTDGGDGSYLSRRPRPTRPSPRPPSRWMPRKLRARGSQRAWEARSRRSRATGSTSGRSRPVHGPEWGWIHLPQAPTHGLRHTSHLAR